MTRLSGFCRSLLLALVLFAGCTHERSAAIYNAAVAPILLSEHVADSDSARLDHSPSPVFGTYNVHWLQNAEGVRADLARLDFVSTWAFQEVRITKDDIARERPKDLCASLPPGKWFVACVPVNRLRELRSEDFEGQVIASRYPIRSAEIWPLATGEGKNRIALAATLEIEGREVLFANTDHAPSIFSPSHSNARQAKRLLARLDEASHLPAIVAGDFNTAGCMPRMVSARGERAALTSAMAASQFTPALDSSVRTYRVGLYKATLDHIFIRDVKVMEAGVDQRATGSDHLPVWCRVSIPASDKQLIESASRH